MACSLTDHMISIQSDSFLDGKPYTTA